MQTISDLKQEYFEALQDLDQVRILGLGSFEDSTIADLLYEQAETLATLYADLETLRG